MLSFCSPVFKIRITVPRCLFYDNKSGVLKRVTAAVAAYVLNTVSIAVNVGVGNQSFMCFKGADNELL